MTNKIISPELQEAMDRARAFPSTSQFKTRKEQLVRRGADYEYENQTVNQLPNYEKLSAGERLITNLLPGFAQSSIAKAMTAFGDSWAGKTLGYLDVLAEGLERGVGTFVQGVAQLGTGENKGLFEGELKSAWYAGSLAADYANTTLEFYTDDKGLHMRVPQELPGAEGLIAARKEISRLVRSGITYKDALERVRAQSYERAGALAIRMQADDLVFHIFGDPINILLGWVKPVERMAAAKILMGGKAIPAEGKTLDTALDVARVALKEAEDAGDAAKVAKATEQVRVAEEFVADFAARAKLGPLEERFLKVVGAMPGEQSWVEKLPQPLRWVGRIATLTPEARAYEYVDNIQRQVIAFVINQADDPYEAVRALQRLASGTLDRQLAHMIVTPQGRAVRGVATAMAQSGTQLLGAYEATTFERRLLDMAATVIQDPGGVHGIMQRLIRGEANVVATNLAEKIALTEGGSEALVKLLTDFGHTAEELPILFKGLPELFKDVAVYSDDLFRVSLVNMVADVAAREGVKLFGVKSRGALLAASEALKASETLAFLRANPAYPIMNWINNDITMLARGAFGNFSLDWARGLWKELGFEPPRLTAGIGMSGMAENIVDDAIAQMSRSAPKGSFAAGATKFADWVKGRNLGNLDMGTWARRVEQAASLRAYTTGFLRGNRMFARGMTRLIADVDPALAKQLGSDVTRVIEDTVRSSMTQGQLDKVLLGENLNLNMSAILNDASRRMGYDIDRVLTTEFTAVVEQELLDAARKSPQAVRDVIAGISGRVQQNIDDLVEEGIKVLVQETAAKVQLEGPGALTGLWGRITDEFYFAHPQHAENVRKIAEAVAAGQDRKTIDLLWRQGLVAEDAYMGRMWNRLEAYIEGARIGAKEALPSGMLNEMASNFRKWRSGWQGFFTWRNKTYAEFFGKKLKGEAFAQGWEQIVAEADARYAKSVAREDQFIGRIDELTGRILPEAEQPLYMSYRARVATWRQADRQMVQDYTQRMAGLTREERRVLWNELWEQRRANWQSVAQEEQAGRAAMAGNQEARATYMTAEAPQVAPTTPATWERTALMDLNELVPDQLYMGTGIDQLWFTRGQEALDTIGEAAIDLASKKPLRLADVSGDLMPAVRAYIEEAKLDIGSRQAASMQFAEFTRDSALLNYNRRCGYNTWLGTLAPYEFWFTGSVQKWVLHSLDRPAMLADYLRVQKFLETAYRPEANLPSRLRGSIRIHLPFLPDWMGKDIFVDPLKMIFPFKRFAYPVEQIIYQLSGDRQATIRKLDELVEQGQITRQEAEEAKELQGGVAWERAKALARQDDAEDRKSAFDLMSMFIQPHAPIVWAYKASQGEEIGTVLPLTRQIGGLAGALGIDPAGPYNPEAAIRKAIGLHPFDEWDDYRVDRMLSNMAGDGEISVAVFQLAMAERGNAKNPEVAIAFQEAQRRAWKEWGVGALGSVIGLPARPYPTGEEKLRELALLYQKAWGDYERGDETAVNRFFEKYPEYETRLALFKKPEERLRQFMVDQLWDKWNSLPVLNQKEAKEQLGVEFDRLFLSKETRAYDMIPLDSLQMWVSLMGGSVPGKLNGKMSLELAPENIAWRAQGFYDTRSGYFPNWYGLQEEYFKLDEGSARTQYRAAHRELPAYWEWRNKWLLKNPDVAPYLTDTPPTYKSEAELQAAQAAQPRLGLEEWHGMLGEPLFNLAQDAIDGEPMPQSAKDKFGEIVERIGLTEKEALEQLSAAIYDVAQ